MWVLQLFVQELVLTLIIAFALYGVWRVANPGKKW
jgi:hypothetical protein